MVQGDITLPSPSVPCLFVEEYTEERLPLALSLLSPFMNSRDYSGRIFVASTTGLIIIIINITTCNNNNNNYLSTYTPGRHPQKGSSQNKAHTQPPYFPPYKKHFLPKITQRLIPGWLGFCRLLGTGYWY